MSALLLLAAALASAAAGTTPSDEALLKEVDLKEAYDAMRELRPRIDELIPVVTAYRDAHAGKAEPDPGGAARLAATKELFDLRHELYRRREKFYQLGTDQRLAKVVMMVFQVKDGKNAEVNRTLNVGYRHAQIVGESKDFERALDDLIKAEQEAYDRAVERWREAEAEKRRTKRLLLGGAGTAVLVTAGLLAWSRRRAASPALPSPVTGAGLLGRWAQVGPPKPWPYGARWECADGAGKSASVRLVDERLCPDPARLLQALKAAAPPTHPGLPVPLEAFAAGRAVAVAYPAASGKPLSVWLEEGRAVPPAQAVVFLRRLAGAVDAAHRAGRAHGGLEPGCVVIAGDGSVSLEDFGVAAALAASGVRTPVSPAYAAPEVAQGDVGPAADLYSLGVMLYELVTGRHPFEGTNLQAMKREKRYAPLSRAAQGCPPALDALVDGLLEPDPLRRRPRPGGLSDGLKALG